MCEIAVVDPSRTGPQAIFQLSSQLYEEQGDGLGVLAVGRDEEEERFEYAQYKSAKPHWQQFWAFIRRHAGDSWRFIIHARAKTAGDVNRQNTHPIRNTCDKCDTKWMVHNGAVSNHTSITGGLVSQGHDFNTPVDSEVISHKMPNFPETLEDIEENAPTDLRGSLNYILAGEEKIVAHFEQKYYVADDFTVSCSTRKRKEPFKDRADEMKNEVEWALITPDGEMQKEQRKVWYGRSAYGSTGGTSGNRRGARSKYGRGTSSGTTGTSGDSDEQGEVIAETYRDLLPKMDSVAAIRVAPGVIKVIEDDTREEYVFRRDEPALYSYFATDEEYTDDEWEALTELFDENGNLRDPEDVEDEVIQNTTQATIQRIVNGDEEDEENFR